MQENKIYSMKEFIQKSGVTRMTVYNWIKTGYIMPMRFRSRIGFTQEQVDKIPEIKANKIEKMGRKKHE